MNAEQKANEQQKMKGALNRFCAAAREFGIVIDPDTVAVELLADWSRVWTASTLLQNHLQLENKEAA